MRVRLLILVAAVIVFPSFLRATPTYTWGHSYGNSAEQTLGAVAIDPFGNILLCGSFYGSITFATTMNSAGNSDVFVAKLDPAGVPLWNKRIGLFPADTGYDVTSDPVGNVIVVGQGGVTPKLLMAKYAPDGTEHWIKFLGPNGHRGERVATNAAKEIVVVGGTASQIGFFAKFDQAGDSLWTKDIDAHFGSAGPYKGLEIDALGQIVMFGQFTDSLTIDDVGLRSKGSTDLFLAKFTTHGVHLWSHSYGSTGTEEASCFALSESGRSAIGTNLFQAVDFGGGDITPTGNPDPCVAVFTPAGTHLWSKRMASSSHANAHSMVFTQNSDLLLSCFGQGTVDFGGGPVGGVFMSTTYVARLMQATGAHRWSTAYPDEDDVFAFVEETQGDLILAGTMGGAVNLGGGELPWAGETDVFAARFNEVLTAAGGPLAFGSLEQNVPNPFNPATTIRYTLDTPAHVAIQIYNATGQTVRRLDDGARSAGPHSVTWDGRNDAGLPAASGVYFYRLEGMPASPARKMTLLK